ncbi:MAG: hypothetical protein FRX49_04852 [Trebouxia sp. A1-2]|nr:MAG: hypothetical protein FRX49_04852 [Trebouxia sp. A1-2]
MCFVVQASLGISRATSVDACALERSQASLASRTKLTSLHPRAHLVLARPFQVCEDSCSTSFPRSRARLNRHACKLPRTNKRPLSLLRLLPRFTKAACVEKASVVVCWILYGRKFAGQHLGVTGASLVLLAAPGVAADLPKAYIAPATSVAGSTSVQNTTCSQLDLADASFSDQNDPVNPFTLFGNTRKKFLIEILEGTKVISRKKGFTTTTCVSGVAIGQQTKQFDNLPESAKTDAADNQLCSKRTGPDLQLTCNASCAQACTAALNEYADRDSRLTGYSIDGKTKDKLSKSCTKQCTYECAKPGDKYGFAIPYRARE